MSDTPVNNAVSKNNSERMPNIAIIGMEGAGKTVLTTTLAKRLSTIDERGVFLNPQGVKTLKYVEGVWHTLQSGDWPPSTPPGEMFELKWKFEIVGETACDVRLIDVAGQDLRLLFGDEQILSVESLPERLKALADYCRSADIVMFLINLKDYLGEGDSAQRIDNEAAIKSAMDYLTGNGQQCRVCLLLTQADLYVDLARNAGGWLELTAGTVPYVFGAHIKTREIAVFPVAAVNQTQVKLDDAGNPRRVPVRNFTSAGLDHLVKWLAAQVRDMNQGSHNSSHKRKVSDMSVSNTDCSTFIDKAATGLSRQFRELHEKYIGIIGWSLGHAAAIIFVLWLLVPESADWLIVMMPILFGLLSRIWWPNWMIQMIVCSAGAVGLLMFMMGTGQSDEDGLIATFILWLVIIYALISLVIVLLWNLFLFARWVIGHSQVTLDRVISHINSHTGEKEGKK